MLKITDDNYTLYKQVFEVLWIFKATLIQVDPNYPFSPLKFLESYEKQKKSIAKKVLIIGLNDILTTFNDIDDDFKKNINDKLNSKGLPSFNQIIGTIKNTIQKVLKRGEIINLNEYYVIKEIIINQNSGISISDGQRLDSILFEFENSIVTKKNAL